MLTRTGYAGSENSEPQVVFRSGGLTASQEGTGAVLTTEQVIRWWEFRRLLYNVVLLVVGVAAIAGMEWLMTKVIPMGEDAIEPMGLVLGVVGVIWGHDTYFRTFFRVNLHGCLDRRVL